MKQQSTTKGFAVLSIAGIVVKILSILYIPFLIHIIGKEGYGIYCASYQVYVLIYVLANAGIPVAISKLVSELIAVQNYKDAVKSFKIARLLLLGVGLLLSLLMIIFAEPLAELAHYEKAYWSILALAPTVFFTSVASAYRGYFQGRGNMTPTAVSQVIEQIVNIVFSLVCALFLMKYGVEAGVAGGTIGTSLGALFSAIYLICIYEKNKKFKVPKGQVGIETQRYSNKALLQKIWDYGIPITLCVGLSYAGNFIDLINVKSRLMVSGLAEAEATIKYGLLGKYTLLLNVPITIISALSAALLPAISSAIAVHDRKGAEHKIQFAYRLCFFIAIPSAIGLAVLSTPIFTMLFTSEYADGAILMTVGSLVLVLMSIVQIQNTILQGIGKLYISTIYLIVGIVAKIAVNYILVANPKIGILGAIYGSIICYLIPFFLNNRLIKKSLKIKSVLLFHAIKPTIAAAFMGVVAYVAYYNFYFLFNHIKTGYISNAMSTVIAIGIGGFSYGCALILNGGINKEDLGNLPRRMIMLIPKWLIERVR